MAMRVVFRTIYSVFNGFTACRPLTSLFAVIYVMRRRVLRGDEIFRVRDEMARFATFCRCRYALPPCLRLGPFSDFWRSLRDRTKAPSFATCDSPTSCIDAGSRSAFIG